MRIRSIKVSEMPPVRNFSVDGLSDVVVLAGPNGVGKTRLVQGMLNDLRNLRNVQPVPAQRNTPGISSVRFVVEATTQDESNQWGKAVLDTQEPQDRNILSRTLQKARQRTGWTSSVIQFESNRSIQQVTPLSFTWDFSDPFLEDISWELGFQGLSNRFQDTQHAIFRKVQSVKNDIANQAMQLKQQGMTNMPLDFPDPLLPFKNAFSQLLAPKELLDPEPRRQQLQYLLDGQTLPIETLSSGEREVINIVFDFILHNASHSIVFFDEPELHLHPELSYKLIQTLRNVGEHNQFVFCTHSPDIITASLENSVIFIAPPKGPETNQAIVVREDDETHQALKLLGQAIGIISLGKKLVLIEGDDTSLDKQTYGTILKNRYPNLILVPSGGKDLIRSFSTVVTAVLERTIWGVQFFMLCDKDALPASDNADELEATALGRLKVLNRYHLENYFLDEEVLAAIFAPMEREGTPSAWLGDPSQVNAKLKELARSIVPYATALTVSAQFRMKAGNLDIMPSGCHGKSVGDLCQLIVDSAATELARINATFDTQALDSAVRATYTAMEQSLHDDTDAWKYLIPGKPLLHQFAKVANLDVGRLKTLYIAEAEKHDPHPFADIIAIFEHFNGMLEYDC